MPTTTVNNFRFAGQLEDQETGTFYNYFRDYQASTGRYLQSDPIGLVGGVNRYAYVEGQSNRAVDPYGNFLFVTGLAGAAFGFTGNILIQLYNNGGQCVNWTNAFVSAGAGFLAGTGVGLLGAFGSRTLAGGINSAANFAQYAVTQRLNGDSFNLEDAGINAVTGFVGGFIAGPISVKAPFATTGFGSNPAVARSLNSEATIAAQTSVQSVGLNAGGAITSNVDPTGSPTCK